MLNIWVLAVFAAYFAVVIGIAVYRSRQMRNMADYVLGGRNVSSITTALSAGSSTTSGWTMLVLPALAFQHGLETIWIIVSIVAMMGLAWIFMAKRLRRFTIAAKDSLTTPEFFERRFGDHTGTLRTVAALITILFVIFYVSSGLVAGAKLLDTIFGLNYEVGVIVTLIAVASYTFIGGFLAVSRTDVFQAVFVLTGFLILTFTLLFITDESFSRNSVEYPDFWNPFTKHEGEPPVPVFVLSILGWGLGVFGAQRILQRFMAIESEDKISSSRNIGLTWITATYFFSMAVGLLALPVLIENGVLDQIIDDPERLYFVLTNTLFHPIVVGILLVAVIAAVMSTADSQLLLASAVATDDLPVIRRYSYSIGTDARMWLGRLSLVVIGVGAALYSIYHPESVLDLVVYAWGGMGAAFGPVTILALYWRRFNFWGAMAAMISGTAISTIWGSLSGGPYQIFDVHLATPGFILAFPIAIAATLLTSKPTAEVTDLFDRVTSPSANSAEQSARQATRTGVA